MNRSTAPTIFWLSVIGTLALVLGDWGLLQQPGGITITRPGESRAK